MYRPEPDAPMPEMAMQGVTSWSGGLAPMGRPSLPGPSTLQGGSHLIMCLKSVHMAQRVWLSWQACNRQWPTLARAPTVWQPWTC